MIVFLGDSFTWGQGLYSKKWIEEGKSIEYCNNNMPPGFSHENISHSDDEYRRTFHFPNLVAKHYDRSYYVKPKNGGTNQDIIEMAEYIDYCAHDDAIDLVVVQFTEFLRDYNYDFPLEFPRDLLLTNIEDIIYEICKGQIDETYNNLVKKDVKNFIFFSWRDDIGQILKSEFPNQYVPLIYKEKEYSAFEHLLSENRELELAGDIGVSDGHFSELGHQVIADSIIKKVDTMNINFIRPREKSIL